MTIEYFIDFITNKTARKHITHIAMERDNTVTPLKSIKFDGRRIYLNITDDKDNPYIAIKKIFAFERLFHSIEGFQYSFIIVTKNAEVIKVHMSMEDGYSPFCYYDTDRRNNDSIAKAICEKLDMFKGKKVLILHGTSSDTFTTFCEEIDVSVLPITGSYIINDFDYKIYSENGLPCVKMLDQTNNYLYAVAMGVYFVSETVIEDMDYVSGTTLYCEGGEVKLRIME